MDWKRIMNKRPGKADAEKAEAAEAAAEKEIREFFTGLIPEINLRLLLDLETETESAGTEWGNFTVLPQRLLWVEAVTVTAYQAAPQKKKGGKPGFIRPWKRLIGMWVRPRSFKK